MNDTQITRLDLLGKTWNAVKVFHSGACETNWDQDLLSTIPLVVNSTDSQSFNASINTMLNVLGENQISNETIPATPEFLIQHQDLSWLNSSEFDSPTTNRISAIIEDFRPRENCFAVPFFSGGNGNFENDAQYYNRRSLTAEQRLLGLFRFWGIYNYYSPYKNIIDKPWQNVAKQYIDAIYSAPSHLVYAKTLALVVGDTQDTHGYLSNPEYNNYKFPSKFLPIILKTIEGKARIFKNPNNLADVTLGDEVISINGKSIQELRTKYKKIFSYSNPEVMARKTDALINSGDAENAKLILKNSENEIYEILLPFTSNYLGFIDLITLPKWIQMDQSACTIGYINMGMTKPEDVDAIMSDFMDKDAIIFDVRNYPQRTVYSFIDYLFSEPLNFANFSVPVLSYPGAWKHVSLVTGRGTINPYSGRVLILMNERTQSHGEFTVMALEKHPNAVKIGSQTAAADGDVSYLKLPGMVDTAFTGLGTFYPDGTPTQRVGLIPDIFVKPTIVNVRNEIDDLIQAATNCDNIRDLDWPQAPKPKSALFWDPKQSGTGRDVAEIGENYSVVPYTYRDDGTAVWYLGLAKNKDGKTTLIPNSMNEYSYDATRGAIPTLIDSQLEFDLVRGPQETQCSSLSQETKSYPSRLIWSINNQTNTYCDEEFIFAKGDPRIDFTGIWYGGPDESGWGISINTQGSKIVVVLYYYDLTGRATWLLGNNEFNANSPTQIELYQYNKCIDCNHELIQSKHVGTLTLSLKSPTSEQNQDNWLTLEVPNSMWNRQQMPIIMLSTPQ